MTEYRLVEVTPEHIAELVANMREEDRAEVEAFGDDPMEALEGSVARSVEAWTAQADGRVIGIFGLAPPTVLSDMAVPWLLTTKDMPYHKREFLVRSRQIVNDWQSRYGLLVNYVDMRYEKALRWLKWLGFENGEIVGIGPDNRPFRRVELRT